MLELFQAATFRCAETRQATASNGALLELPIKSEMKHLLQSIAGGPPFGLPWFTSQSPVWLLCLCPLTLCDDPIAVTHWNVSTTNLFGITIGDLVSPSGECQLGC